MCIVHGAAWLCITVSKRVAFFQLYVLDLFLSPKTQLSHLHDVLDALFPVLGQGEHICTFKAYAEKKTEYFSAAGLSSQLSWNNNNICDSVCVKNILLSQVA